IVFRGDFMEDFVAEVADLPDAFFVFFVDMSLPGVIGKKALEKIGPVVGHEVAECSRVKINAVPCRTGLIVDMMLIGIKTRLHGRAAGRTGHDLRLRIHANLRAGGGRRPVDHPGSTGLLQVQMTRPVEPQTAARRATIHRDAGVLHPHHGAPAFGTSHVKPRARYGRHPEAAHHGTAWPPRGVPYRFEFSRLLKKSPRSSLTKSRNSPASK